MPMLGVHKALKQGQILRGHLCAIAMLAKNYPLQIYRLAWRYVLSRKVGKVV